MPDRRVEDRRQPEEGVIKIKFQDAVWYIILVTIIIISVIANIVLAINNSKYKKEVEYYSTNFNEESEDTDEDLDDYSYEDEDDELVEDDVVEDGTEIDSNQTTENKTIE